MRENVTGLKSKVRALQKKTEELELNQRSHDIQSKSAQTDDHNLMPRDQYEKLLNEKNFVEKKLSEVKRQFSQEKLLSEKENMSVNRLTEFSSTESGISDGLNNNRLDYESLDNEYKKLQKKYETAKRLCNLRMEDMTKLREELVIKTNQAEIMTAKYEKAKQVCEIRMEKIRCLREKLGINGEGHYENIGDSISSTISEKSESQISSKNN